jgi:hypothetical protein
MLKLAATSSVIKISTGVAKSENEREMPGTA